MRKAVVVIALAALLGTGAAFGIAGTPDRVAAATLVVPFFEVGIDIATNPEDTLLAIWNAYTGTRIIHYQVWDIDGAPVFNGNLNLLGLQSWNASLRDRISFESPSVKAALTVGAFYRGFVTFDVVTAETALTPADAAYPFSDSNALEGFIYYVRLLEGSANGISMVPIEHVGTTVDGLLYGFYQGGDGREEIDVDARACAEQLAAGVACTGDTEHASYRVHQRAFGSVPLGGATRLVIFTWTWGLTGGPSALCGGVGCATDYTYRRYDESGAILVDSTITLPHVVNVIDFADPVAGFASIWDIPSVYSDTELYAFSFNSASPGFDPSLTWDAIFEAYIEP